MVRIPAAGIFLCAKANSKCACRTRMPGTFPPHWFRRFFGRPVFHEVSGIRKDSCMDFSKIKTVHFFGIGGIGTSAIARMFLVTLLTELYHSIYFGTYEDDVKQKDRQGQKAGNPKRPLKSLVFHSAPLLTLF